MPGMVGFTNTQRKHNLMILANMRFLLKYSDHYVDEELFSATNVLGSNTHLSFGDQGRQPYICDNRIFAWMTGELYNQEELKTKYRLLSKNDNQLLVDIYKATESFSFLEDVDGYYAAAWYDKSRNRVHLISDRYGFNPLYWGIIAGELIWSSELKGFLAHPDFKPILSRDAVEEFFCFGHQTENLTWFEGIELIPASSVLTFDMKTSQVDRHRYWSWEKVRAIGDHFNEGELIDELIRLFSKSVQGSINPNERVALELSGGLDSRAILAAVPEDYNDLQAITFGQKFCDDVSIASKAAKVKGVPHHIFELNGENWLMPRIGLVWASDARSSMEHMHGLEFVPEYRRLHVDVVLNGLAGDLVFGGSYLKSTHLDRKVDPSIIRNNTHTQKNVTNFDPWYMINKTDPYFINNRVRRFANSGLISTETIIPTRRPFFNNELIHFIYGIPDSLRYKDYIYKKVLLKAFPKLFRSIPWQASGYPISYPRGLPRAIDMPKRIVVRLKREAEKFGFKFREKRFKNYADYYNWIRMDIAKVFFQRILLSKNALYPAFVNERTIHSYLMDHMTGQKDCHSELLLALTFELWLQQVFEGKYRDSATIEDYP